MYKNKSVRLILENGTVFHGQSFGAEKASAGEVVFNTSMVGYPESLTDPSYQGQILTMTYPIIGNYGVPGNSRTHGITDFFESGKIHVSGLIVQEYSDDYSHWNSKRSLSHWLKDENIPGVFGIDIRMLTKILREYGSMKGKIVFENDDQIDFYDPDSENQVDKVSCKDVIEYSHGSKKVVLIDCGVKLNIIRELIKQKIDIIRVPWDYDFTSIKYDGLFISNGPGSPDYCNVTVENIRKAMNYGKPIFGICMGNQLLAKAAGTSVYKLKYGHRGSNQPVRKVGTNICYITSQNHGYAVDDNNLSSEWTSLYVNMNDGTNEGIKHKTKPFYSVQFHPEASGGPTDTKFFFKEFVDML
ncbi:MAG: glutamine-hydrolyzing carbamoyl-phosphate synthase small subunit [Dysgonamonadaceae bacterium]|nr:glutamine-hydrolyzing carbamoyl-phosphate synthase small subunit [Dysgonamonadaceae bacterium]MDD3309122.1 glutamine-hydrolyzing carbamoyl-phosphate synthase small subunit [Dysgonamonadaceae bacterium]MDD4397935.1 glutamine-hydrolyzing carbamoyl-phosphate synthase small subunit [Dysgonamonadaceae bacterium]